jgi:hypothetical protein
MAAQDRKEQLESLGDPQYQRLVKQGQTWTKADGFAYWLSNHYLALFNIIVLVYLGLPILAPVLMNAGVETPARLIYRVYGTMCHQWSFRSFFLFGNGRYIFAQPQAMEVASILGQLGWTKAVRRRAYHS